MEQIAILARGESRSMLRICALPIIVAAFLLSPSIFVRAHVTAALDKTAVILPFGHNLVDQGTDGCANHDATDHEHQLQAFPVSTGDQAACPSDVLSRLSDVSRHGLIRDGPRRPPRLL